ncbi:hypothetical protein V6N13_047695 [Hibiscus sabdariffa]|uniref:Bet v I/Major latex protein domain-containing protein n=1 Tax=Hibiscus sabdariffa TaxID=183260 RepID=A0ABR2F4Y6_9ROSI
MFFTPSGTILHEGDLRKEFKSMAATLQASSKRDGSGGGVVHWTLECEKLHHEIDHPETLLQFLQDVSKDVDAISPEQIKGSMARNSHACPTFTSR